MTSTDRACSSTDARPARTWSALGTYVYLSTSHPGLLDQAQAVAERVLAAVDRACSRFRVDSDLSRANVRPGSWVAVDPLLVAAVQVGVEAARETDGLVDPCLGRSMVHLGYDADLALVRQRRTDDPPGAPPVPRPGAWREIGLDPAGALRVPADCSLDLGATAKAWASDLVAASVVDRLGCHVVVSLGGDLRIDGPAEEDDGWPVGVAEDPGREPDEIVRLRSGGIATSTTTLRRWTAGGVVRHHLLDPRTGSQVTDHWRTATATGPTSVAANTATTAAMVLGDQAPAWLARRSVDARLVAADGTVTTVGRWPGASPRPPAGTALGHERRL